jgi:transposase
MPGLITTPEQIWLVVTPVDLRRGIDGLSSIVQQTLGHSPCAGSALYFVTEWVIALNYYCGMEMVSGYVNVDYIRGDLSGRKQEKPVF